VAESEQDSSTRRRRRLLAGVALVALWVGAQASAASTDAPRGQPGDEHLARGSGGAAATIDRLATRAAIRTLRRGGNAVDAAVAAAGVLGVTEPFSAGIGGGGFMLVRTPRGRVTSIDGREAAPAAMKPRSFFENDAPLDFGSARFSGLSAGVPGTVATWVRALKRHGTMSLREVLEPGIEVAREGFRVDQTFFDQTVLNTDFFDDVPSTAALYLDPDGTPRDVGTLLRNRGLARAYQRIAKRGRGGFYDGRIAGAIADAAQNPPIAEAANHVWRPGLITRRDLKAYKARGRKPTRVRYRGFDVWGMGPPSSGGSTVAEALNILEGYSPLGADRAQALHRFLEASRYAFADRDAFLADPAFVDVPLAGLLSDSFAAERRALITDQAADAGPVAPGEPRDNQAAAARASVDTEGTSTTHLTVVDRRGMAVSYTFTIESTGGNGIVVPGWGFLLNNELTDFNYGDPSHPNAPNGRKRPRSSMAPTIVTRSGRPVLALGSPGGSTIITTVLQILIERFDLGKSLPQAIAAPRASQRNSTLTTAEPEFTASPVAGVLGQFYGHGFISLPAPLSEIGAATGIEFLKRGRLLAVAEPVRRGGGTAMVVGRRR
jgi:gamma-glutamyltranspeptidase/glutathione hydrolase